MFTGNENSPVQRDYTSKQLYFLPAYIIKNPASVPCNPAEKIAYYIYMRVHTHKCKNQFIINMPCKKET